MHWSDAYLGREYDATDFDCATLACEVAAQLGMDITLPSYTLKRGDKDNRAQLIATFKDDYAKPVDAPIDGHPVLLVVEGKPKHIGVCAYINQTWYVVHNSEKLGVVRPPLRTIRANVEGFYQWLT